MLRKENSFAGQPVVLWEGTNEDQCFGGGKELDDRGGTLGNRVITDGEGRFMHIKADKLSIFEWALMRQWNTESARLRHIKELKQTNFKKRHWQSCLRY